MTLLCGNNTNLLRNAVISALNVVSSNDIARTDTAPKIGRGVVRVSGPYTGAADRLIDVEILGSDGATAIVSLPVFAGVGNGTMSGVTADGSVDAQSITVQLEDLGSPTKNAIGLFQGQQLNAVETGEDGNGITIMVDRSAVTTVLSPYSVPPGGIQAGTNEYTDQRYNFGAVDLTPDGKFPVDGFGELTALRIMFGDNPRVFRQYRKSSGTGYVFGFSPVPDFDVEEGTPIFYVTNAPTLTVTKDATTENLGPVYSLYEALAQFRDVSALVKPNTDPALGPVVVVTKDLTPGGKGVIDVDEFTESRVVSITRDGSQEIHDAVVSIIPSDDAPTEILTLTALANGGSFRVDGSVSGRLDDVTAGATVTTGPYVLSVSEAPIDGGGGTRDSGPSINAVYVENDEHGEDGNLPFIEFRDAILGPNAKDGDYEFTWRNRPPPPCDGSDAVYSGGVNADCIGVETGGTIVSGEDSLMLRLQQLASAVRTYVVANTSPPGGVAALDIQTIENSGAIFEDGATKAASGPTIQFQQWAASTAYAVDQQREPNPRNGYRYVVTAITGDAKSGSSAPTWPTTIGDPVTDGNVTWKCLGKTAWGLYDEYFAAWQSEMANLAGVGSPIVVRPWSASANITLFATGGSYWMRPSTRNGWLYKIGALATPCRTSASESSWPTIASACIAEGVPIAPNTTDGPITWCATINYWNASSAVALDKIVNPGTGILWKCTDAGTTGSSEPDWTAAGPLTDGSVEWTRTTATDLTAADVANMSVYQEKWRTQMAEVAAVAGLAPNFESASVNGDGCWQDTGDSGWWESSDGYLPFFNGKPNYTCVQTLDENGDPVRNSTKEFCLGIEAGCVEKLRVGDRIIVSIRGVGDGGSGGGGPSGGYSAGDQIAANIAHGEPVSLAGGQSGNDAITFSVVSSIGLSLPPYVLSLLTPNAYDEAGIGFQITPGTIAFALGDRFTFDVETGQYRLRVDGGTWTDPEDIGDPVSLANGLVVTFIGGNAPSWVNGDAWSFLARAVNGTDALRSPSESRLTWTSSTTITITPGVDNTGAPGFLIADHEIPSDATITLTGGASGYVSAALTIVVPWRAGSIWVPFATPQQFAEWRLTINRGGSINWAHLGAGTVPRMKKKDGTTPRDHGTVTKSVQIPSFLNGRALGGQIVFTWLSQDSVDEIVDLLGYACTNDDRRFGFVPNATRAEAGLVSWDDDELSISALRGFGSIDIDADRQGLTLAMTPIA